MAARRRYRAARLPGAADLRCAVLKLHQIPAGRMVGMTPGEPPERARDADVPGYVRVLLWMSAQAAAVVLHEAADAGARLDIAAYQPAAAPLRRACGHRVPSTATRTAAPRDRDRDLSRSHPRRRRCPSSRRSISWPPSWRATPRAGPTAPCPRCARQPAAHPTPRSHSTATACCDGSTSGAAAYGGRGQGSPRSSRANWPRGGRPAGRSCPPRRSTSSTTSTSSCSPRPTPTSPRGPRPPCPSAS